MSYPQLIPTLTNLDILTDSMESDPTEKKDLTERTNVIILIVIVLSCTIGACVLLAQLFMRRDIQPLKIKSPRLLIVSVAANLFIIIMLAIVQIEQEICVNSEDGKEIESCTHYGLQVTSLLFGFLVICLAEPLALSSYVLRAIRLKKIFDAQQVYFHEGRKPTDLIDKFREARLLIRTLLVTVIITLLYLIVALILNYAPSGRSYLYVLPSMNTSSYSHELINE